MKLARKRSERPSSWFYALLFNSLLLLLAILGAKSLATAFNTASPDSRLTTEILVDTRRIIDRSLGQLAVNVDDKRANWANRVKRELVQQDLSAARGFLLAAPAMLDSNDVLALKAAAESEPAGSEDQRLVRAALLFLPNDVRQQYEILIDPPDLRISLNVEDVDGEAGDAEEIEADETAIAQPEQAAPAIERNSDFSILGTEEDLVTNSQRWIALDPVDIFVLRLAGLAHLSTDEGFSDELLINSDQIAQAASILKSAKRANRLNVEYLSELNARLDLALPQAELEVALSAALSGIAPRAELIAPVKEAFRSSLQQDRLAPLMEDFLMISDTADDTSPTGALFLLEQATSRSDVLRARRIARAGSDRAVALVKEIGPDALVLFENHVKWSQALVIQIMVLAGGGMALLWTVLATLGNAFTQRPHLQVSHWRI